MAKSKWDSIKDKLTLVEAWARDGLIDEQIMAKLGISKPTFYEYQKKYPNFLNALKKGKEIVDIEVENSLLKRAKGYVYNEVIKELVLDKETGESNLVVTKVIKKEVVPDTTAQIFWLKNRKPKEWRDKQEIEHSGETTVNSKIDLTGFTTDQLKEMLK